MTRRFLLPLAGFAAVLALAIPFLFWYQTWFGRHLTDVEIAGDLDSAARPRDTQHALTQLAEALQHGDAHAQRWYPQLVEISHSPNPRLRAMSAWVMGQDNRSPIFHDALLTGLRDPDALVRRNAALALVRFGDSAGKPELLTILRSSSQTGAQIDEQQVWEALRALYLTGDAADLPAVQSYRSSPSAAIRAQADITAQAIRIR